MRDEEKTNNHAKSIANLYPRPSSLTSLKTITSNLGYYKYSINLGLSPTRVKIATVPKAPAAIISK
jgi:hypothetical protein